MGEQRSVPNTDAVRRGGFCSAAGRLACAPSQLASLPAQRCFVRCQEGHHWHERHAHPLRPAPPRPHPPTHPCSAAYWPTTSSPAPCHLSGAPTAPYSAPWSACEAARRQVCSTAKPRRWRRLCSCLVWPRPAPACHALSSNPHTQPKVSSSHPPNCYPPHPHPTPPCSDLSSSSSGMNLLTGPFPASWGPPALQSLVWM